VGDAGGAPLPVLAPMLPAGAGVTGEGLTGSVGLLIAGSSALRRRVLARYRFGVMTSASPSVRRRKAMAARASSWAYDSDGSQPSAARWRQAALICSGFIVEALRSLQA
jgi:hypothetical protein